MTRRLAIRWSRAASAALLGLCVVHGGGAATEVHAAPAKTSPRKGEKKAPEAAPGRPKTKPSTKKKAHHGAVPARPPAPPELPAIARRVSTATRIEGGPAIVVSRAPGGLFLHVDFDVSPRLDPEGRPGLGELAARAWFVDAAPLWQRVADRGGAAALRFRGNRIGLAIALPKGEGAFASWLLPRLFDRSPPRPEAIGQALRAIATSHDPVHDTLIEQLHQGAKALAHRADASSLATTSSDELAGFLAAAFAPERATVGALAAPGDEICDAACSRAFAALSGRAGTFAKTPPAPEQTLQRTVELPPTGTTAATYGFLVAPDPRREAAVLVAAEAACADDEGRLAARLDPHGATCRADLERRDGPGLFTLRITSDDEALLGKAIARVDEELLALQKNPLSPLALARARDRALLGLLVAETDPAEIAAQLAEGRSGAADFAEAARGLDPATLADELSKALDPLRRVVVVERNGKERLWRTPRPAAPPPKKGDPPKRAHDEPGEPKNGKAGSARGKRAPTPGKKK